MEHERFAVWSREGDSPTPKRFESFFECAQVTETWPAGLVVGPLAGISKVIGFLQVRFARSCDYPAIDAASMHVWCSG